MIWRLNFVRKMAGLVGGADENVKWGALTD
jgi:hypothetical protein